MQRKPKSSFKWGTLGIVPRLFFPFYNQHKNPLIFYSISCSSFHFPVCMPPSYSSSKIVVTVSKIFCGNSELVNKEEAWNCKCFFYSFFDFSFINKVLELKKCTFEINLFFNYKLTYNITLVSGVQHSDPRFMFLMNWSSNEPSTHLIPFIVITSFDYILCGK